MLPLLTGKPPKKARGPLLVARGPLYMMWFHMIGRCLDPENQKYHRYGGRGIGVTIEWGDFLVFRQWALDHGWKPGLQIERSDNDGHYEPDNVCFVTPKRQQNNRSSNHRITAFGDTKTIAEWLEDPRCVVKSRMTLYRRIWEGWPPEQAISLVPIYGKQLRNRVAHA